MYNIFSGKNAFKHIEKILQRDLRFCERWDVAVSFTVAITSLRKVLLVPYIVGYYGDARVSRFQFPSLKTAVKKVQLTLHTP